ncbi:MAG: hypothetical protein ACI97P_001473, partial [Arcticibacterium sp.]
KVDYSYTHGLHHVAQKFMILTLGSFESIIVSKSVIFMTLTS